MLAVCMLLLFSGSCLGSGTDSEVRGLLPTAGVELPLSDPAGAELTVTAGSSV